MAVAGAAIAASVAVSTVSAQSPAERSIQYRQGVMKAQGWHTGNMAAQVKGDKPYNKDDFLRSATFLSQLSHMAWDGFGPGTEAGAPTKAKPEIWKEMDKFKAVQTRLQTETAKLAQVAATGDMGQIKGQFGETGKVCANCHDTYRTK
jgi:cytochrome c556